MDSFTEIRNPQSAIRNDASSLIRNPQL